MGGLAESSDSTDICRRKFFKCSVAVVTTAIFPQLIQANNINISGRSLDFINLHTDEKLSCCYWESGRYIEDGLKEINFILRDHRANEVHSIDRSLLDLLHALHEAVGSKSPYQVISAYRSPETNKKLRKSGSGVAKKSLHMQGKAIDIRLPDINLTELRDTAMSFQAGGVGYYQDSDFLHIDIGRTRTW